MNIDVITRIDDRSAVFRAGGYHDPRSQWEQKLLNLMARGEVARLAALGWIPLDVEAEEKMQDALQSGLDRCEGL
jgi:hypothetical protein